DGWAATGGPPPPTSQPRQPASRPRPSRWRKVEGSKSREKASKRSMASGASLERRYPLLDPSPAWLMVRTGTRTWEKAEREGPGWDLPGQEGPRRKGRRRG